MARLLVFLQSLWALLGRARAAEAVSAGRNPKTGAPSLAHKLECHTTERQMYPNVRRTGSEGERERRGTPGSQCSGQLSSSWSTTKGLTHFNLIPIDLPAILPQ